ncbi:MAG TPA: GGDEF domain-containing protein [Thermoanaerobaculia bacterium]|nr:GGDEF domain-containing protein [Thermoanaerobaculia bacterium]
MTEHPMELLLWRWSTALQIASALMIAVFFTAFAASVRTAEQRWWMRAWLANLFAIAVTIFHWYFEPQTLSPVTRALYLGGKGAFVFLMIEGVWAVRHHKTLMTNPQRLMAMGVYAIAGGYALHSLRLLGFAQYSLIFIAFMIGAAILLRDRSAAAAWLAAALFARGIVALIEIFAYLRPADPRASLFLSASSSFDAGAEWFVALGCVLVTSARTQGELRAMNRNLVAAQEELRALADRDPLTGLANRRSLAGIFRDVYESGATILFFDLDGFKEVNDVHGQAAGDEHLKRFATALRTSFRPSYAVVRYAGDEFLVIAPRLGAAADDHLADLTARLDGEIAFSVGSSELAPRGNAEEAVRAADAAMYHAKARTA